MKAKARVKARAKARVKAKGALREKTRGTRVKRENTTSETTFL